MRDRLLRALRGAPVDTTPVWIMRQAGRYLPEYRKLRERFSMLEMCRRVDLAVEVTLQPLRRFDLDAAILFSDLLVPLWGMGWDFDLVEGKGPVVRPLERVDALEPMNLSRLDFVFDTIQQLKNRLEVPLLGFTGAPLTFASYLLEGRPRRDFARIRALYYRDPQAFHALMDTLSRHLTTYLKAQVDAGVDAVQLFDSWAGSLPSELYAAVLPYVQRMVDELTVPVIFFSTGSFHLFPLLQTLKGVVLGVDWRVPLRVYREGWSGPIQGNLDPAWLLASPEVFLPRVQQIVQEGHLFSGHVFNLGHGILPETPPEHLGHLVEAVHAAGCSAAASPSHLEPPRERTS